jgi:nitronate monooxygenase
VRGIPWPTEFTGRALDNDFSARWHGAEAALETALSRETPRYNAAATIGDFGTAVIFAGEASGLVTEVLDAGEIVSRMIAEAEVALRAGAALIE